MTRSRVLFFAVGFLMSLGLTIYGYPVLWVVCFCLGIAIGFVEIDNFANPLALAALIGLFLGGIVTWPFTPGFMVPHIHNAFFRVFLGALIPPLLYSFGHLLGNLGSRASGSGS